MFEIRLHRSYVHPFFSVWVWRRRVWSGVHTAGQLLSVREEEEEEGRRGTMHRPGGQLQADDGRPARGTRPQEMS